MICPTLGGSAPAIIANRHVDAAVDEELHGFVILVPLQLMQDACGLMGAPVRVDIGPVREKKFGDLEVVVEDGPGERSVLRFADRFPLQSAAFMKRHILIYGVIYGVAGGLLIVVLKMRDLWRVGGRSVRRYWNLAWAEADTAKGNSRDSGGHGSGI